MALSFGYRDSFSLEGLKFWLVPLVKAPGPVKFGSTCRSGLVFSHTAFVLPAFLFAVLDALIGLFFRSDISAETLWVGGWLLRQLLSYNVEDSSRHHPELLKVRRTVIPMLYFELHKNYINCLLGEVTEIRCDVLIAAIIDAWKKWKRAIEVSALQKDPKRFLLPSQTFSSEGESSSFSGKRMYETFKSTIDNKHLKWLHLCIRPSTLPFTNIAKTFPFGKGKSNALVDGIWTLAFRDDKVASLLILEEMHLQSTEVKKRLHPLVNLERPVND